MVESEFERLEKTVSILVERFSKLKEERNDLVVKLEDRERMVVDLKREVEKLSSQKDQARQKLDGLIVQLDKLSF